MVELAIIIMTYPGTIVHKIVHRFFCDIAKIPVYDINYLGLEAAEMSTKYEEVKGLQNSFLISIGPFIVNSLLCALLAMPYIFSEAILNIETTPTVFGIVAWIGVAIGMNAFPSKRDTDSFLNEIQTSKKGVLFLIALPFAVIIKIADSLRHFFFYLIYVGVIIHFFPKLLLVLI